MRRGASTRPAPGVSPARACAYHGRAPRVRAGRVRRPGAARRGRASSIRATARSRWRSPTAPCSGGRRSTTSSRSWPAGRPRRLDAAGARRAAARAVAAAVPRRGRRPRRGPRVGRARQALTRRGARRSRQRRAAPRRPARAAAMLAGARRRHARSAPRCCTRCPVWLAEMWFDELGAEQARALLAAVNRARRVGAAGQHARRDPPTTSRRGSPVAARRRPGSPEGLVLDGPFDAHGSRAVAGGGDHAPVARLDARRRGCWRPQPGERVLDLCAAPGRQDDPAGGADGRRRASCVAVERHPGRAQALQRRCERMHVDAAPRSRVADARRRSTRRGALRPRARRPAVQRPGHAAVAPRPALARRPPSGSPRSPACSCGSSPPARPPLRPGGTLVYSVCTISRAEREGVIERFLAEPRFAPRSVADVRATAVSAAAARTATAPTASSSRGCAGA